MRNQKLEGLEETRELWLPNSMLIEILSRLPSKTLAWVRFLSKECKCIVSDRKFIRRQLKHREQLSGFFFQEYERDWVSDADFKSVSYVSVDKDPTKVEKGVLNFLPKKVVILSSSNGLICCRSSFPCLEPVLYVCNPLNRECITLQWPNIPKVSWPQQIKDSRTVLIFEPFKSNIDVSTDFQVVIVCETILYGGGFPNRDFMFSFNIYSSQTKAWTKSREICTYNRPLQNTECAVVEGDIFWLTVGQSILMFKPKNELCFLVMKPFPAPNYFNTLGTCLGEAEGKLQFLRISKDGIQVWELKDWFSSHWIEKHYISLEDIEKENPCMESHLTTTTFPWINSLSFKDMTLFLRVSTYIYAFNFDTRKAKLLCPYSAYGPKDIFEHTVVPYTMSLAPLS